MVVATASRHQWPQRNADRALWRSRAEAPTFGQLSYPRAKAEHSEAFTGDDYVQASREYPSGRHHLLMGTGHMVMWEGVANTVAVLDDFLR